MNGTFLIITTIAKQDHPVIQQYVRESAEHNVPLIIIGDEKSPKEFKIEGCDYYSIERQQNLNFELAGLLPFNSYARKNLGYLVANSRGACKIIETDDDNLPLKTFWNDRTIQTEGHLLINKDWVNIYRYFTKVNIWPRGFSLEKIHDKLPELEKQVSVECPIQQGLADENPDVDALYRLICPLPVTFEKSDNIALGINSICPFNSQNTTWFRKAFLLLYLPSSCSFRMIDIWRSFIAQRIAWTCGWSILFHQSTVLQKRNDHNLMKDFCDEISGYNNNAAIINCLKNIDLKEGIENIGTNMVLCYGKLIESGFLGENELILLNAWLKDVNSVTEKYY
ncbi:MAG: hypothetical protein A2V64_09235 [Bacteroidetes bacterium RBG_13_43_22]|nr:MAG: hypothetical protein A2V64_09235 [Bacteroidetes bacterium RBG_13_43_22]